jgi:hypothetical protein
VTLADSVDPELHHTRSFTYYVTGKALAVIALHANGATKGVVGTWSGGLSESEVNQSVTSTSDTTITLEFRADGTVTRTSTTDNKDPDTLVGTYTQASAGVYQCTYPSAPSVQSDRFQLLDGVALGFTGLLYTK